MTQLSQQTEPEDKTSDAKKSLDIGAEKELLNQTEVTSSYREISPWKMLCELFLQ